MKSLLGVTRTLARLFRFLLSRKKRHEAPPPSPSQAWPAHPLHNAPARPAPTSTAPFQRQGRPTPTRPHVHSDGKVGRSRLRSR